MNLIHSRTDANPCIFCLATIEISIPSNFEQILPAVALVVASVSLAVEPAIAHGFGERYDLPLPLNFWLLGAAASIVLSFVVVSFVPFILFVPFVSFVLFVSFVSFVSFRFSSFRFVSTFAGLGSNEGDCSEGGDKQQHCIFLLIKIM